MVLPAQGRHWSLELGDAREDHQQQDGQPQAEHQSHGHAPSQLDLGDQELPESSRRRASRRRAHRPTFPFSSSNLRPVRATKASSREGASTSTPRAVTPACASVRIDRVHQLAGAEDHNVLPLVFEAAHFGQTDQQFVGEGGRRQEAHPLTATHTLGEAFGGIEGDYLPSVEQSDPITEPLCLVHVVSHQ